MFTTDATQEGNLLHLLFIIPVLFFQAHSSNMSLSLAVWCTLSPADLETRLFSEDCEVLVQSHSTCH